MNLATKAFLIGLVTGLTVALWPLGLYLLMYLTAEDTKDIALIFYALIGSLPAGVMLGIITGFCSLFFLKKKEKSPKTNS